MSIINTVAEVANFEVEITMSYIHNQQSTNLTSGLLKELHERRVDIAVGTISPTIAEHEKFDFSVQYMQDESTWVVPADIQLPHWVGLLIVFQPTVFGVTFLLLILLWLSSSQIVKLCEFGFRKEHECFRLRGTLLFITIGMLLANEPSKFPRTRFLKAILIMWSLFSFYWNSAFSATLISVITNTVYKGGVSKFVLVLNGRFSP